MKAVESDKPASTFRPLGPVVRADEAETWFSAAAYLADARRQCEQITAQARLAFEEQRMRGFEDGRLAGVEQAARLIAETKVAVHDFVADLQDELITLVVEIVREILGSFEPNDLAARAITRALEEMRVGTAIVLMTAPQEMESIRGRVAALLEDVGDRLTIVSDPQIAPGRCMLWSEFGQIDVSVDAQLEQLAMALHAGFEEVQP
ncbi:NolV protein [Bradyrhizobium oligotrophicum S58]|uniref:Type 3 secretion system stator protein n=1 Tax=Bradyrhizobium oligotrophicum S58 TaxID=1245469 RepID=M4ZH58_9BRAD|nr:type III secretion system stator protein SctL [Bradyrhizobium oligotrophicum]BAM93187.1 NolV protein [Bradyrhizobium oligotrophicum S58]